MPEQKDVLKQIHFKLHRLKELGKGLRVDRVLGDRVLVKTIVPLTELDEVEKRGMLYIPDSVKAEYTPLPTTGIVLACGPLCTGVKAGDCVLFPRLAGVDFTIAEQDLRILETKTILCVLVDTDNSIQEVEDVPHAEAV